MLSDLIQHGPGVRSFSLPKTDMQLHCMPTGAGYEHRANEVYSWEGLKRGPKPFVVLQHTISGRGQLDYAGARHVLLPGKTMVLSFPHRNRYWLEPRQSWEYFWIGVNGSEALRVVRTILDAHGPVLSLSPQAINRLAAACRFLIASEAIDPGQASASAYEAVMALYDGAGAGQLAPDQDLPPFAQRVQRYVDEHLSEPLGVERLAAVAQLSRAHFVRSFATAFAMPPSRFVVQRRIERAARLLLATDGDVTEIARATGFSSANYFGKVFRHAHGTTPSAYRQTRGDVEG